MKITSVTCHLCRSHASVEDSIGSAIVEIGTDEGIRGLGEPLMGMFCGEAAQALVGYYTPMLLGQDALDRNNAWKRMWDSSVWWGRGGDAVSVMGGIINALWDIAGKAAGKPCYQLIRGSVPAPIPVYASLGLSPHAEEIPTTIARLRARGFRALKIGPFFREHDGVYGPRGSQLMHRMHSVLSAIRCEGGPEFGLMFDGHMGGVPDPFSREEALDMAHLLEEFGCRFFEEPLSYLDPEGYAWLKKRTRVRISGGESLSLRHGFERFLRHGALDILQPDANFVGGVDSFSAVVALASENRLDVIPHAWSGGPGVMANIHLAFGHPAVAMLEVGEQATDLQNDTIVSPLRIIDGCLSPPTEPGLGSKFSPEVRRRFPFPPGLAERASGVLSAR